MRNAAERIYLNLLRKASHSRFISFCLFPLLLLSGVFFGIVVIRRAVLRSRANKRSLHTPVISVGNITVGGTGKTPFAALLLSHLTGKMGLATRGYRRQCKKLYITKGEECSPKQGGDEAALLGRRFPSLSIAVSDCKWEAVQALDGKCEIIILDDGLQRYDIPQYIRIATVDSTCPDGYGWLLPRGLCREPFSWLRSVDYIAITNSDSLSPALLSSLRQFSRPIIITEPVIQRFFSPDGSIRELPCGQNVALFSGIANPGRFRKSMEKKGLHVVDHLIASDHGIISDQELQSYKEKIHSSFPEAVLVGTEKDWARKESWSDSSLCFSQMELQVVEGHEAFLALLSRIHSAERAF
jgi:tetraacyldisaccharide 4'-kinase